MKHTPGPWTTDGYSIGIAKGTIAQMYRPGDATGRGLTQGEQEANAHLIAAAPDLLAAAEAIRAFVVAADRSERGDPCAIPEEMLRALLDAHQKAQGGGA